MIYQLLVLLGILLFFFNFALNLLLLKRPSRKAALPDEAPLVSVLVPARNEEDNIAACLASLLRQDYPNFELLVLDDNSTDRTPEIIRQTAGGDPRVRLMQGGPLPAGWAGKCYACHQLSQQARGEWLLFVDADTECRPWTIRSTLAIALINNISMLSGFPRQEVNGLSQKIVVPILFYFLILSWFPLWWLHLSKKPRPTLAIGQFLLFNSAEYRRIGGHEVVKSRIMEDVWFGIEMVRSGGRTLSVDLSRPVTTHAYNSITDMTEGCLKWFYSVAMLSPMALIGFFLAAYLFYMQPFLWAAQGLSPALDASGLWAGGAVIIMAQAVLVLLMRIIADLYFKGPVFSFLFHPLGMTFLFLTVFYAFIKRIAGTGVAWKERVYHVFTNVK